MRNAVSFPTARVQIILNCRRSFLPSFARASSRRSAFDYDMSQLREENRRDSDPEAEPVFLRVAVMLFMMASCWGLQVLFGKARHAEEESREFVARQEQLRAAGRLAAEIAHQIKNPLGIINNAAFALQRSVFCGQACPISRNSRSFGRKSDASDRIMTELMGYAQLAEGHVERLK